MDEDAHKPSLAVKLGSVTLLVLNSLAAVSGALLVGLIRSELKQQGGEKWGLLLVPPWSLGGLVVTVVLFIATVAFVVCAREKVHVLVRWMLLLLVLAGVIFHIAPAVPEYRVVTVPLVEMFE